MFKMISTKFSPWEELAGQKKLPMLLHFYYPMKTLL